MVSTLVCRSGRTFVRDKLLQAHPKNPKLNIYLAHCEGRPFVLKPVSQSIFEHSQELKHEFADSHRLRTHVDYNEEKHVFVYEYFKENLLSLVQHHVNLPIHERKWILQETGQALKELHDKNWIHLDTKPDNVMINWSLDKEGQFRIERLLDYRLGNVMWRSPEGQMGKGIGKPSEVFSFGLICLYTITGVETLHADFEQLRKDGTEPEHVILFKLLSFFGPLPDALVTHVDDQHWGTLLKELSQAIEDDEELRDLFEQWEEGKFPNLFPEAKRLISTMMNLDPGKRATIGQILQDHWWR